MKKNLEIIEYENKATRTEPPQLYTRFQTNEGWMSCFNPKAAEELKKFKGRTACVETKESTANKGTERERVFQNIEKCYGEASRDEDVDEVEDEVPIEKIAGKPGKPVNSTASMYTSYAKDIFCAITEHAIKENADLSPFQIMERSIDLVKQAKEAFE